MACECVSCPECRGLGQVEVHDPVGYPEYDLESCGNCEGTGRCEICSDCLGREEHDDDRNL